MWHKCIVYFIKDQCVERSVITTLNHIRHNTLLNAGIYCVKRSWRSNVGLLECEKLLENFDKILSKNELKWSKVELWNSRWKYTEETDEKLHVVGLERLHNLRTFIILFLSHLNRKVNEILWHKVRGVEIGSCSRSEARETRIKFFEEKLPD